MPHLNKLIVFTYSYPFGIGEEWKYNEFIALSAHFSEITIQPMTYGDNSKSRRETPQNVSVNEPLLQNQLSLKNLLIKGLTASQPTSFILQDFWERKVYRNLNWFKSWLSSSLLSRHLSTNKFISSLISNPSPDTVLYFYWGTGPALLIPFFEKKNFSKVVARFHGGDLYEERWDGYLPFRNAILKNITHALFISEQGLKYATEKYPTIPHNSKVSRLGVVPAGKTVFSQDHKLRLVSCSMAVPVKRLSLLIKALHYVKAPVEWTHIGDGPLLEELKMMAKGLPDNVQTNFTGFIPSNKVLSYYNNKSIDLFINVSESEGVPVSIMEALSAGIPVYATNVGGTGEIVNSSNGKLFDPNISPEEIGKEIQRYSSIPLVEKEALKAGAFAMFENKCNALHLYKELAAYLSE